MSDVLPKEIARAIKQLGDSERPWIHRRDAADFLGEVSRRALSALNAHKTDSDTDVRSAVETALGRSAGGLAGVEPVAETRTYSAEELARACEKPGERAVRQEGEGYVVEVQLASGRHQEVHVVPFDSRDRKKLIRVSTYCGEMRSDALAWALRANVKIPRGAISLMMRQEKDTFILAHCLLPDEVTPRRAKAVVKEIAFYGDWIEKKLTGLDEF